MVYNAYANIRDLHNLKDADVARATGISPVTFTDWKKGKSSPKIEKVVKIAEFFNVPIDMFMSKEELTKRWEVESQKILSDEAKLLEYLESRADHNVNDEEYELIKIYRQLDLIDKVKLQERASALLDDDKYKKEPVEGGEVG